jgi:hypothetical protein
MMHVDNGSRVDVMAVGTLPLCLPSRLILVLNKCYSVPALSMNIVSVSRVVRDGYFFKSETNGCSICMNNIFYVHTSDRDGLFILNLDCNDSHINSVDTKRCKLNDDNTMYMWHCHLGHIGVKCMKDGLLESLDFDSLDRCESCLMAKMTKTLFTGFVEWATDLLGIIHTDVCEPMSVSTCNGYCYFVTFIDDLSRYGYTYLMKHKSEIFKSSKNLRVR